ncbi:hypothetical protein Tco_0878862 [Tanacetum coccineum]|uniref:Uncharacterized protein n=1 Tax=Tanacetum coccineum TaxID=301880 RepID=A0ABQ5BZH1_9ASTR
MQGTSLTKQEREFNQSSTPHSITYPPNNYQTSAHHNVYSPSLSIPQIEYSPTVNQQSEFSQLDPGLTIPVFKHGDDPIDAINHVMSFLFAVVTSRYPTTNNQLRNSSNPRQQATINDGRVTVQPVQGRQISLCCRSTTRNFHSEEAGSNMGNRGLFLLHIQRDKASGFILYMRRKLAFLANPGYSEDQATQTDFTHNCCLSSWMIWMNMTLDL